MNPAFTSTGMRMTQNLLAPQTQNTAPVHEFRCLYTSDLRRKQKRWQDGFLRFHTFNKRVMVYEAPSRNYVGDKHWREDAEPQDGDELQLEKPILVQVGEQIGSTETDLTELLEKRRKRQDKAAEDSVDSPQRQASSSAISKGMATPRQPVAQPSQLRPKTLNALLGTPKGPIGRASMPTKSPHELRHAGENAEWGSDRPAKRKRIDTRPEATPMPTTRPVSQTLANEGLCVGRHESIAASNTSVRRPRQAQPALSVQETIRKPEPALRPHSSTTELDKTSVDPSLLHRVPAKKFLQGPEAKSTGAYAEIPRRIERPRSRQEVKGRSPSRQINESRKMVHKSPTDSPNTARRVKPVIESIELLSEEEASPIQKPLKERVKLQMALRKPRKKLMYRDLLPQQQPSTKRSSSGETGLNCKSRQRSISRGPSRGTTNDLIDFHQKEQDRLAARYNGRTTHCHDDFEDITGPRAKSPGLFVSQEDLVASSSSHHRTKDRSPDSYTSSTRGPSVNYIPEASRRPPRQGSPGPSIPKAASTIHDTALTLSKMDEILFPRTALSHPIEISRPRHAATDDFPVDVPSPSSIPLTPPKTVLGPTPQKRSPPITLIPSSPGFQTQSYTSPRQSALEEAASSKAPTSRPRPLTPQRPSLSAQSSLALPIQEVSPLAPQPNATPTRVLCSKPAPPTVRSPKAPSPKPLFPEAPPPNVQPQARPLSPMSPNKSPPTRPSPRQPLPKPTSPKERSPNPCSPRLLTLPSTTTTTTQPLFSKSPDTSALEFDLRIAQKPLPAFQAPRPKPRPRSPLKKSTSDTTTMRPPPVLPDAPCKKRADGANVVAETSDGTATPWSKEAWDLFGCGRDGVQCSYEEFKRKEGLG